jgi:hypothetical protein
MCKKCYVCGSKVPAKSNQLAYYRFQETDPELGNAIGGAFALEWTYYKVPQDLDKYVESPNPISEDYPYVEIVCPDCIKKVREGTPSWIREQERHALYCAIRKSVLWSAEFINDRDVCATADVIVQNLSKCGVDITEQHTARIAGFLEDIDKYEDADEPLTIADWTRLLVGFVCAEVAEAGIKRVKKEWKFEVGKKYVRPGLYGPSFGVVCTARTENTATFVQAGCEEDKEGYATIEIIKEDGVEACLCWESQGSKAYIHSNVDSYAF